MRIVAFVLRSLARMKSSTNDAVVVYHELIREDGRKIPPSPPLRRVIYPVTFGSTTYLIPSSRFD